MKEFAPYTCPPGYYNFICEVTDSQRSPVYMRNPGQFTDTVLQEVREIGFVRDRRYVDDVHVNPVLDTYPIYYSGYLRRYQSAAAAVREFSDRIALVGRSGAFWYNNSDHSIRMALETARRLVAGQQPDFDFRSYFGGTGTA